MAGKRFRASGGPGAAREVAAGDGRHAAVWKFF
jgi:hypothetical protein